jgi:hypothetical protein
MELQCDENHNRAWGCLPIKNYDLAKKRQQKTLSVIKREYSHGRKYSAVLTME